MTLGPGRSTVPPEPHGLGGPRVNQGAITECLSEAPLPICDSGQNPRRLVLEPRLWEGGEAPHKASLSSPHSLVCFSAPHSPRWGCTGQEVAKWFLNTERK